MAGESISGQAQLLGAAEATTGDYRWFETVLERLSQVTPEDVERVRATYLTKRSRTVGWYEPEGGQEGGGAGEQSGGGEEELPDDGELSDDMGSDE